MQRAAAVAAPPEHRARVADLADGGAVGEGGRCPRLARGPGAARREQHHGHTGRGPPPAITGVTARLRCDQQHRSRDSGGRRSIRGRARPATRRGTGARDRGGRRPSRSRWPSTTRRRRARPGAAPARRRIARTRSVLDRRRRRRKRSRAPGATRRRATRARPVAAGASGSAPRSPRHRLQARHRPRGGRRAAGRSRRRDQRRRRRRRLGAFAARDDVVIARDRRVADPCLPGAVPARAVEVADRSRDEIVLSPALGFEVQLAHTDPLLSRQRLEAERARRQPEHQHQLMRARRDLERGDVERAAAPPLAVDLADDRRPDVDDGHLTRDALLALIDLRRAAGDERGCREEGSSTDRLPRTHGVRPLSAHGTSLKGSPSGVEKMTTVEGLAAMRGDRSFDAKSRGREGSQMGKQGDAGNRESGMAARLLGPRPQLRSAARRCARGDHRGRPLWPTRRRDVGSSSIASLRGPCRSGR